MKMQGGKKLREGGNQLDPARKLMMVAASPRCDGGYDSWRPHNRESRQ
jgi:hypothetical protein